MAAGQFQTYEKGLLAVIKQTLAVETDTLKAALLIGHTVDLVTHEFWSEISADEVTDSDYGQQTLANVVASIASGKVRIDCDNISFGNPVSITAKHLVIFKDTGTPASSPLLFVVDLNDGGGDVSSVNAEFDVNIAANGVTEITANG